MYMPLLSHHIVLTSFSDSFCRWSSYPCFS